MPYPRTHVAMRKIDWGGAGQIPEALGQDRCGSFLSINRDFFPCKAERSTLRLTLNIGLRHVGCNAARPLTQNGPFRAVSYGTSTAGTVFLSMVI